MTNPRTVAILVFDDIEILDFAGPHEVFNLAGEVTTPPAFTVFNVGLTPNPVIARGKLVVAPRYSIDTCPQPEVLVIPGGFGTRALIRHGRLISWIADQAAKVEVLLSVCTGALLLAKAGLLAGHPATTHHESLDHLKQLSPTTEVVSDKRFVQSTTSIVTSGGISAGIDASLHVVERLAGIQTRDTVIEHMEYGWHR